MSYTEVTSQSWGSRLLGSIKGVLSGLILFLGSFVLLWWNEGRAVKTAKGLEEGSANVVSVAGAKVDAANEGKLVHFSGLASTEGTLTDDEFGVEIPNALRLKRTVEMYQWVEETKSEKRKKVGGAEETVTTYDYKTEWKTDVVNSDNFKVKDNHLNPDEIPYESYTKNTEKVTVGEYTLSESLVSAVDKFETVTLEEDKLGEDFTKDGKYAFWGSGSLSKPEIGDVRIYFEVVKPTEVSVIAQQTNQTLVPYSTSTDTEIEMLTLGTVPADKMFETAQSENTIMTWILRFVGFILMTSGLSMFFKPLVVVADVLPFLGNLLSMGLGLFSGLIAFSLSLVTIAIAWIFYRPVLGISVLIIGIGTIVYFMKRAKAKKEQKQIVEAVKA